MGGLHAVQQGRPGVAAQQSHQPRPQHVVAHLGQPVQFVQQFLDGQRRSPSALAAGTRPADRCAVRPSRSQAVAKGPGDAAAQRAVEAVNPPRPWLPRGVPPIADFVDQHAGGQRGPADPRHFRGRQRRGGRREIAGRPADRIQIRRQAVLRIEHPPQCPAEGADLDRVESAARPDRRGRCHGRRWCTEWGCHGQLVCPCRHCTGGQAADRSGRRPALAGKPPSPGPRVSSRISASWHPAESHRTAVATPRPPDDRRGPRRPTRAGRRSARRRSPARCGQ